MSLSRAIYRCLLRVYPRDFRAAHGADAADVFVDLHRAAWSRGIVSGIGLWWRTVGAVMRGGLHERRAGAPAQPGPGGLRPRLGGRIFNGEWRRDARFAVRSLRKSPAFTAVVLLTLALGIGANTAIFSIVNAVLVEPLPYPEPERLVRISWQWTRGQQGSALTAHKVEFWRRNSRAFESVAAIGGATGGVTGFNLASDPVPQRLSGIRVSRDFFRVFGVEPAPGRGFTADEDAPGGAKSVVISHELWQRQFGGREDAVGGDLLIDGFNHTVVGILPREFRFGSGVDIIVALQLSPDPTDGAHNYRAIGRLAPGSSPELAAAEAVTMFDLYFAAFPDGVQPDNNAFMTESYSAFMVGDVRQSLLLVFGAVGLVLLIACANVANLMLARAASRNREVAIRSALGASRGRLFRQMLVESLLLVFAAAALGVLFARWTLSLLIGLVPLSIPRLDQADIDPIVLGFTLAVAATTALVFGLTSTLRISTAELGGSLKDSSCGSTDGGGRAAVRSTLVVAEVALAALLLVGAALLLSSLAALQSVSLGFDPEGLLAMEISMSGERYASPAASWAFERDVLERIRARPGVVAAGAITSVPLEPGLNMPTDAAVDGEYQRMTIEYRPVSPGYFATLGISVVRGRAFVRGAAEPAPVAIVNETFAQRFWPQRAAIGERLIVGREFGGYEGPSREIIGVVAVVLEVGVAAPPPPTVFVPRYQAQPALNAMINQVFPTVFIVRATAFDGLTEWLRTEVAAVDPLLPVVRFRTMHEVATDSIAGSQFNGFLMGSFAGLALFLTSIGVYGVLSYSVSRQTREIGVRIALGAPRARVIGDVVWRGLRLVGGGMALGLAGAWWMSRLIEGMLFSISRTDPRMFLGVSGLLVAVALLACLVPAYRAARVDPIVALRPD